MCSLEQSAITLVLKSCKLIPEGTVNSAVADKTHTRETKTIPSILHP